MLKKLHSGEKSVEETAATLRALGGPLAQQPPELCIDLDRRRRCGYPEVIFCTGKSTEAVVEGMAAIHAHGDDAFATRASAGQAEAVLARFPQAAHNPTARTVLLAQTQTADRSSCGTVVVVTAGTSDRPVAEEAVETLRWMNCGVELVMDVGVAGPHRLTEHLQRITAADVVVVIAGMEGALPSIVGGWVDCPVIAVPTSIGYGASFGGVAALLGMLNSCAANVTVVNIDAGFKGGYVAGLIASRSHRPAEE
ncbi:MAG: nickel pincer cofactor biosynthesis protein LarB [Planctomycetes bacterium]|nr:nickel pincer cofactor biosynthesis protein LarB [Planctomycetota bacterium]